MAETLSWAQEEATAHPYPTPIPIDEAGLYQFITDLGSHQRGLIHAWLWKQYGGTPQRWEALVDPILDRVAHDEDIDRFRDQLAAQLTETMNSLTTVVRTAGQLAGDLYDVEHAESSQASLFRHYLEEASRALHTASLINPTRPTGK